MIDVNDLNHELTYTMSRSSGPGGQNVNKVNTKVTLKLDVRNSTVLSPDQKDLIIRKLANRLTKDGVLVISAQEKRSQIQNKEAALAKLGGLLSRILTPRKPRKATKPGKAATHTRIRDKKRHSEKKVWRSKNIER